MFSNPKIKKKGGRGVQQVKAFATMTDNPSLVAGTHMVKRENNNFFTLSSDLHSISWCAHAPPFALTLKMHLKKVTSTSNYLWELLSGWTTFHFLSSGDSPSGRKRQALNPEEPSASEGWLKGLVREQIHMPEELLGLHSS